MSVLFTGTNQGRFTSDGTAKILKIRCGVDFIWTKNETQIIAQTDGRTIGGYWQLGMTQGQGLGDNITATTKAITTTQLATGTGFYLIDSSLNIPGPSLTLTGVTNDAIPRVSTANTTSLLPGDVVRLFNITGAKQLATLDFTVGAISAGVYFQLAYMAQIVASSGGGTFRKIPFEPLFYPSTRTISKIVSNANGTTTVTLTVTHNYLVGQEVRFVIPNVNPLASPPSFGMTELDGVQAPIIAVDTTNNTITVQFDTSSFTAFSFPVTADAYFTPAQVVPIGENTATALQFNVNEFNDARINTGYIGIKLMAGVNSPAGSPSDVIYWVAGKSFNIDNE